MAMLTILFIMGWRLFFYSNEGNEPIRIHCKKGDMECKYWLDKENFTLAEAYSYNMNSTERRNVKNSVLLGCQGLSLRKIEVAVAIRNPFHVKGNIPFRESLF